MSGSGGFYKYRCKYFYTHNCPNWVYVNNSPCANCCAEGRDVDGVASEMSLPRPSHDICVPRFEDGVVHYTLMELVNTNESPSQWILRYKVNQTQVPTVMTTSATPGAPIPATSY
ncbi:uncharacterized protein F4812DRAFT_168273 [Daldinia caldariorum]|uniref:uncharacterized protein n=1 Tax=Daldinia caldariorum TaxID=326644 RepID=UPI00200889ED|nr:uncharacterized protein F4812DRAFT_168273 [Daldinia caldariorum]KAI1471162.1 hypothetical protein F4812DRAFT_168273 [Daldinia caldariorum]